MKFSLVMATVDRITEVERFLTHLNLQTFRDFELIVVDQNADDRLLAILAPYFDSFLIKHIRIGQRGAARARNLGIKHAQGEIIGFPDDDCWYPPDYLHRVFDLLSRHSEWDGLSGRCVDMGGNTVALRFDHRSGVINRYNVWRRALTFTMFVRNRAVHSSRGFDNQLGVGAGTIWGSGEETDYLISLVDQGLKIYYVPSLFNYHPDPFQCEPQTLFHRAYSYGCGMGRVMRKNNYPFYYMYYYLLRAVGGGLVSLAKLDRAKFNYYQQSFQGRLHGWRTR